MEDIYRGIIEYLQQTFVINKDTRTYHNQTDTFTNVDLSIVSPDIVTEYECEVEEDLCGSDILLLIAKANNSNSTPDNTIRHLIKKADWSQYEVLTTIEKMILMSW